MNTPLRAAVRYAWLGWRNDLLETLTDYGIDEHRAAALASWVALNTQERGGKLSECLREANDLVAFGSSVHVEFAEAQLEEQSRRKTAFRSNLRNGVRAMWLNEFTLPDFRNHMLIIIRRGYTDAWHEGLAMLGLKPADMSGMEMIALNSAILSAGSHVSRFGVWLQPRTKAEGVLLRSLWPRLNIWLNGYDAIMNRAKAMAGEDLPLRWTIHPAEHCPSCLKLNGKVKRASWWTENGILPRIPAAPYLICKGFN